MRLVPIECVRPNTMLGKTLYDLEGRVLLKSGVMLGERVISKIRELNILSLYIIDEYSSDEIEDIIKPELRQKAIITIKKAFSDINKFTVADKYSKKEEKYYENIGNMTEDLIDEILNNKEVTLSLVDIRSMDNYIYAHSVNVAIISLILGIKLKLPKSKLKALCMGALLHDIGKSFIPKEILNKNDKFTLEEIEVIKKHSNLGYRYLSDSYNLSANSKMIVLQHHERVDGKGYPDNLSGDKLNTLSKIVSIANTYDYLSTDSPNRRAMVPSDVLEYLMSNAGIIFDYDMVNIFCKIVVPFTKGTLVTLSNDDTAIVEENTPNLPLRPTIKILDSSDKNRIGIKINLVNDPSLVINKICYQLD
ncbi:HD-GYP domain-containing protein [Clostridium sp. CTA-5]